MKSTSTRKVSKTRSKRPALPSRATRLAAVDAAIAMLERWADESPTHVFMRGAARDDSAARMKAHRPVVGRVPAWQIPPSFAHALTRMSSALMKWGDSPGHDEFMILSPRDVRAYNEIVYLPAGVSRGADGPELSTNHLVAFASAGDEECAFCFDVAQDSGDGEYPVYFHHQDHPRARVAASGAWADPADATPDFASFAAWLTWVAHELSAGREPASSQPTAFKDMPGHAKPRPRAAPTKKPTKKPTRGRGVAPPRKAPAKIAKIPSEAVKVRGAVVLRIGSSQIIGNDEFDDYVTKRGGTPVHKIDSTVDVAVICQVDRKHFWGSPLYEKELAQARAFQKKKKPQLVFVTEDEFVKATGSRTSKRRR